MNCYRCNATLDLKLNQCVKCGADIRVYKKIVYASNRKYNEALLLAEARNLTGAKAALKEALHFYAKNIPARNLLGLVEYSQGDSAQALKEWVISKNLSDTNPLADRYINAMRRSLREKDSEAEVLKMYNRALEQAENNSKDMAVIQLKKIISVNPGMTKAYELLGLLYLSDDKIDKAKTVLERCLTIDTGNVNARRYLKEIENRRKSGNASSAGTAGDSDRDSVIIPVRYRDTGSYLSNALYVALGLLLGVLIAWFVLVPGKVEKEIGSAEEIERSYEEKISDLQEKVASREAELQALRDSLADESESEEPETEESGESENPEEPAPELSNPVE